MTHTSSDVTDSFISEVTELLDNIRQNTARLKNDSDDTEALKDILRNLHTIKGNSRMLDYSIIEKLSHALEDVYKSVKDGKVKVSERLQKLVIVVSDRIIDSLVQIKKHSTDNGNIDIYLTYCDKIASGEIINIDEMQSEIRRVTSSEDDYYEDDGEDETNSSIASVQSIRIKLDRINDIISSFDSLITREFRLKHQLDNLRSEEERSGNTEISKIRKQFTNDLEALESTIFSVQQQIFDLRMLPLSMVLNPLRDTIERESLYQNKPVLADIPETQIALDKLILEQLLDILNHLVRNSFDHGIETAEERKALKKNSTGKISITCKQENSHVELRVSDDGRGIDYEKVRAKAMDLFAEKADEIKNMSEKELSTFLFSSGFSTKDQVTELSGRGVGLDIVRNNIEKIKGKIQIESTKGKGTSFILTFPLSLATLQGLFIYSGGRKLLMPSQHLSDIVYRKSCDFISLQNQSYLQLNGELVPIFTLSSLFDAEEVNDNTGTYNIIIAEYMEQKVGIIVDEVQRYVSLVVKPLPKSFENFSILQGIVFDERYAIVPILYVPDIITRFKALRGYDIKKYEAKTKKRVYRILVADDSPTTLQIEKTILENAGFLVDTANDGIDGLEQMKQMQYDLIISDVEMPRMDGAVFLNNIRRNDQHKKTPVIIVSSVSDKNTTELFKNAGANAFMVKSDFKRDYMIATIKELLNA